MRIPLGGGSIRQCCNQLSALHFELEANVDYSNLNILATTQRKGRASGCRS